MAEKRASRPIAPLGRAAATRPTAETRRAEAASPASLKSSLPWRPPAVAGLASRLPRTGGSYRAILGCLLRLPPPCAAPAPFHKLDRNPAGYAQSPDA